jgi:hypothetical protein
VGLWCLCTAGCGADQVPVWETRGKVVFADGSPVTMGLIELTPIDRGPAARAKINLDGTFVLKTGERNGAIAGTHRVAVVQVILPDVSLQEAAMHHHAKRLHPKFARPETSGLTSKVEARHGNELRIEVTATVPGGGWDDRRR